MTPELGIVIKATVALTLGLVAVALSARARASIRHLVLVCTLAALLALPVASGITPVLTVAVAVPAALAPRSEAPARQPAAPAGEVGAATIAPASVGEAREASSLRMPPLSTTLRAVWVSGVLILLAVLAHALWHVARIRRSAIPWLAAQAIADRLTVSGSRPVSVVCHERVPAPITCGWRHPMVVFPIDAQQWSADDLERALVHELEHVRRGDWAVQLAARGVCAAYWFHPLVWVTWRRLCLECERACDDAVVERMADTEYAQQLVTLAGRLTQSDLRPVLSMARRSDLTVRVKAVLDRSQLRGRAGTSAVAAALLVTAIVALTLAPMRVQAVPVTPAASVAMAVDAIATDEEVADIGVSDALVPAARATVEDVASSAAAPEGGQRASRQGDARDGDANDRVRRTALGRGLVEAAQDGDLEGVAELLDAGADVNALVRGDGTALLIAARRGDRRMVEMLLQRGAADIAAPGDGSALIQAARQGFSDIVRMLIEGGADVDLPVAGDGSPLIMAARGGHAEIVRMLLDRGADVNLGVQGDGNPLIMAARGGHVDILRMLLDRGAIIDAEVPGDENAIISGSEAGHLEAVRYLVSRGANVNSRVWAEVGWPERRGEWRTPLNQARRNGHDDVVRYLLSVGATEQ